MDQQEVNVLALVKGKERYVFLYNAKNRSNAIETFGRFASDPELSFSWRDAAVMTQKTLREKKRTERAAARAERLAKVCEKYDCEEDEFETAAQAEGVARGMRRLFNDILGE